MSVKTPLKVVLCWHMHQPQYFDPVSKHYSLPWTYLHAIKDYADMAAHLENNPGARAVVNFAPTLLEQIDDYVARMRTCLDDGSEIADPLLNALVSRVLPVDRDELHHLMAACLKANRARMIDRFADFQRLAEIADRVNREPRVLQYLSPAYFADLLVWYHLAWLGESVREIDPRVKQLESKEMGYTLQDRQLLFQIMFEVMAGLLARYRRLAEAGRVELSVTPYAHPILPLLLEPEIAREAMPEVELPEIDGYPGGEDRAHWHVEHGLKVFEKHFGFRPTGCWPAEGGVGTDAVKLLGSHGFKWIASGQGVLGHSLEAAHPGGMEADRFWVHQPYEIAGSGVSGFFRDDGLSDLIGFEYAEWHGDDAVANFVHHLKEIASIEDRPDDAVVSIIMDGENAWEYYPKNGKYFLDALYRSLSEHEDIDLTTFEQCLATNGSAAHKSLPALVSGSWVYGTFSTWIGDSGKNRGWELLTEAKQAFDREVASGRLAGEALAAAQRQLGICEGSDWFWWFGDYNPADSVSDFEHLFRCQLSALYRMLDVQPPESLEHTFTYGTGDPARGGVMRQGAGP